MASAEYRHGAKQPLPPTADRYHGAPVAIGSDSAIGSGAMDATVPLTVPLTVPVAGIDSATDTSGQVAAVNSSESPAIDRLRTGSATLTTNWPAIGSQLPGSCGQWHCQCHSNYQVASD
jgi:hypothetical protein